MSFEIEEQSLDDKVLEAFDVSQKLSKITYTREFIISLSELEICKKLPRGFDRSLLGEFEDASHNTQERARVPGGLPFQGFRRSDYGSSPPIRGDSSHYSRGSFGRWESRSSGQSDKDTDSQSDRDSDSGRRYGNPSRRWQNPEHDGLLGSGSFPRPSGYAAPKVRGDDHYQLKKSNEPYNPPRPYLAVPHTRGELNDSLNDETFGSTEYTSEDRAEEERKRRASFELMRKEQQKVLQEKQKVQIDKHKNAFFSDETVQAKEGRASERNNVLDGTGTRHISDNEPSSSSFPPQTSASRPLVPPGFARTNLEKYSGPKVLSLSHEKEIGKRELEERILQAKSKSMQNVIPDNQEERQPVRELVMSELQIEDKSNHAGFPTKGEMIPNSLSGLDVTSKKLGLDDHLYSRSSLKEANEASDDLEIIQLNNKVTSDYISSDSNKDHSTSLLEKLFGSSLTVNTPSNFIEPRDCKPDVTESPNAIQSSKFAHWFLEEEEKKPADNLSTGRLSDLLSLIVGGEKQASDVTPAQHFPAELAHQSSELSNYSKVEPLPAVLTCEDLEQKILSEYSDDSSSFPPPVQHSSVSGQQIVNVDNHASLHLLSLLQKGTDLKDMNPSPNLEIGPTPNNLIAPEAGIVNTGLEKSAEANAESLHNSGKNITLETLFGNAFMMELQSIEEPVSVHRRSINESGSNRWNYEKNIVASNLKQQTKVEKVENWLGFENPKIEVESSKSQNEGRLEFQLPEEESLITVGDSLSKGKFLSLNTSVDVAEKLAVLNTGYKDEQSMRAHEGGPHLLPGPYELMEPERQYQNLHVKASPPQFHSPHLNHGRPFFHPIDSPMNLMVPENIIQHDGRTNNQFPINMIRQAGFDPPAYPQMLHQMQMPDGRFPPTNLLHEFPRGGLVPHPSNQRDAFMQESNPMQGFPFSQQRPNINGLGMPLPVPDVSGGNNHPEALQRLIAMELRANPKQLQHPFGVGHSRGIDMGFRYR